MTSVSCDGLAHARALLVAFVLVALTLVCARPSYADEAEGGGADAGFVQATVNFDEHTLPDAVNPPGATLNLFDYWTTEQRNDPDYPNGGEYDVNGGINEDHALKFVVGSGSPKANEWTGSSGGTRPNIVQPLLGADGYPALSGQQGLNSTESLSYLFSPANDAKGKATYPNVEDLLRVDDEGYYYYSSFDSFASFDEATNKFKLYDAGGMGQGGTGEKTGGQFFPFNTAEQVFSDTKLSDTGTLVPNGKTSKAEFANHYFGLSMSTRFVQEQDGMALGSDGQTRPMTFTFSGDDDVWLYIDGVLIGDLGGIHNPAGLEIDFSTGKVTIAKVVEANGDFKTIESESTLKQLFDRAGAADTTQWRGDTFANNTYHTLKFFYLERGNYDSNMSLKFNLVNVPVSSILKIDQAGVPLEGAGFELYRKVEEDLIDRRVLAEGVTDENGQLVLLDPESGMPISFDELANMYRTDQFVLDEIHKPDGYRSVGRIYLQYHRNGSENDAEFGGYVTVVLQGDGSVWQTGAYANAGVQVTAPHTVYKVANADGDKGDQIGERELEQGTLFAVVLHREKQGDLTNPASWSAVTGNAVDGWQMTPIKDIGDVINVARTAPHEFSLSRSGGYEATIEELPGEIDTYYNLLPAEDQKYKTRYTVNYYFTTGSLSEANTDNTYRLYVNSETTAEQFQRRFSIRLNVPNTKNYLIVQKLDQDGYPIEGSSAKFGLFPDGSATWNEKDGTWTLNDDAVADQIVETSDLTHESGASRLEMKAAAVFPEANKVLAEGTYFLAEVEAPKGYTKSNLATKVVVTKDGVYADAGIEGDGITVRRGVGSLVKTLAQFGTSPEVNATLHDVTATLKVSKDAPTDEGAKWESGTDIGSYPRVTGDNLAESGRDSIDLTYGGEDGAILEYKPLTMKPGVDATLSGSSLGVDVGWPALDIAQKYDAEHKGNDPDDHDKMDLTGVSLNNLFSNTCIVRVQNQKFGALKVTKTVEVAEGSASPDPDDAFEFTVKLWKDTSVAGTGADASGAIDGADAGAGAAGGTDADAGLSGGDVSTGVAGVPGAASDETGLDDAGTGEADAADGLRGTGAGVSDADAAIGETGLGDVPASGAIINEGSGITADGVGTDADSAGQLDAGQPGGVETSAGADGGQDLAGANADAAKRVPVTGTFDVQVLDQDDKLVEGAPTTLDFAVDATDPTVGVAVIELKAGQTIVVGSTPAEGEDGAINYTSQLPAGQGIHYAVSETKAPAGYELGKDDKALQHAKGVILPTQDPHGAETVTASFTNIYDAYAIASFGVSKEFTGRAWNTDADGAAADAFTFKLNPGAATDADGNPLKDAAGNEVSVPMPQTRGADGAITTLDQVPISAPDTEGGAIGTLKDAFANIRYTVPGIYTYTITEAIPADATNAAGETYAKSLTDPSIMGPFSKNGITYSQAEYQVTVTVEKPAAASSDTPDASADKDELSGADADADVTAPGQDADVAGDEAQLGQPAEGAGEAGAAGNEGVTGDVVNGGAGDGSPAGVAVPGAMALANDGGLTGDSVVDSVAAGVVPGADGEGMAGDPADGASDDDAQADGGAGDAGASGDSADGTSDDGVLDNGVADDTVPDAGAAAGALASKGMTATVKMVQTKDDEGKALDPAVSVEPGEDGSLVALFKNSYRPTDVKLPLTGKKVLSNEGGYEIVPNLEGAFEFELTGEGGAKLPENAVDGKVTVASDKDGVVSFGDIAYTREDATQGVMPSGGVYTKTYTYTVREIVPGDAKNDANTAYKDANDEERAAGGFSKDGITYDSAPRTVTVTLTYDSVTGVLAVSASSANPDDPAGSDIAFEFINEFKPAALSGSVEFGKYLDGRDWLDGDAFTFELTPSLEDSSEGMTEETLRATLPALSEGETSLTVSASKPVDGATVGIARFEGFTFTKPGTYGYTVREVVPPDAVNTDGGFVKNGITYSAQVATVTFTVVQNPKTGVLEFEDAQPKISGLDNAYDVPSFVNTYSATAQITLAGAKVLEGREFKEGDSYKFTFSGTVEGDDEAAAPLPDGLAEDGTLTISPTEADGNKAPLNFGTISFTLADVGRKYIYEIAETGVNAEGVSRDPDVRVVRITVEAGEGDGNLVLKVTDAAEGNELSGDALVGALTFTNKFTSAPAGLGAKKVLEGQDLTDGRFTFVLYAGRLSAEELQAAEPLATAKNVGDAVAFPSQAYVTAGTYEYTIVEYGPDGRVQSDPNGAVADGVTYDSAIHYATVTVTRDEQTNALSAAVSYDGEDPTVPPTFRNVYEAAGEAVLTARKIFVGDESPELAVTDFSFELFTGSTAAGEPLQVKHADESGVVTFDDIRYTLADLDGAPSRQLTYTVREVVPGDAVNAKGVSYDEANEAARAEGGFVKDGVTYDSAPQTYTVTLTDNGSGAIEVTVDKTGDQAPVFTNTYNCQPVETAPSALKTMLPAEGSSYELKGAEFSFTLTNTGAPEGSEGFVPQTKSNDATGAVAFDALTFTRPGTYTFTLAENPVDAGAHPGVSRDEVVYTLTYIVEDNGAGQLVIAGTAVTASRNGEEILFTPTNPDEPAQGLPFVNGYEPSVATYEIGGTKTVVSEDGGISREPVTGEFSFQLEAMGAQLQDGTVLDGTVPEQAAAIPMPEGSQNGIKVVPNAGAGFGFGAITYAKPGSYTYRVSELVPDSADPTITYSTQVYSVVVTVTDEGGQLVAAGAITALGPDGSETPTDAIAFENTYTPQAVSVPLGATKQIIGRDMLEGEAFTFELRADEGDAGAQSVLPAPLTVTVTDLTDGAEPHAFTFPEQVTFAKTGTYTFVISELADGMRPGLTPDATSYKAVVTVTENAQTHALEASVAYLTMDGQPAQDNVAAFVNSYAAKGELLVSGSKTLTGRPLEADEFSFVIVPLTSDGSELETVATGSNGAGDAAGLGAIAFTPITYTLDVLAGAVDAGYATRNADGTWTLSYRAKELVGEGGMRPGVTLEVGQFDFTVTVSDNHDGTLSAVANLPEGGLAFVNAYNKGSETWLVLSGTKAITGLPGEGAPDIEARDFSFTLTPTGGTPGEPMTVPAVNADPATWGTFSFPLSYTLDDLEGIPYDERGLRERTFTYRVTENVPGALNAVFGVTYDPAVYDVTVVLTDNRNTGEFVTNTAVVRTDPTTGESWVTTESTVEGQVSLGGAGQTGATFTNEYHAGNVEWTPQGTKETRYAAGSDLSGYDGTFGYTVYDNNGGSQQGMPVAHGISNANGAIDFSAIRVPGVGTYHYVVREDVTGGGADPDESVSGGITYDATVWYIELVVEQPVPGSGEYTFTATYSTEGSGPIEGGVAFVNEYESTGAHIDLWATKTINDPHAKDGFLFSLTDVTNPDAPVELGIAASDENGIVRFPSINYAYYTTTQDVAAADGPEAEQDSQGSQDPQGSQGEDTPGDSASPETPTDAVTPGVPEVPEVPDDPDAGAPETPVTPDDSDLTVPDDAGSDDLSSGDVAGSDGDAVVQPGPGSDDASVADGALAGDGTAVQSEVPALAAGAKPIDSESAAAPGESSGSEVAALSLAGLFEPSVAVADDQGVEPYIGGELVPAGDAGLGAGDQGVSSGEVAPTTREVVSTTDLGMHVYKIAEINTGLEGVTYDDRYYLVYVNVTDDPAAHTMSAVIDHIDEYWLDEGGAWHVTPRGTDLSQVVFENSYRATTPASLTLEGTKVLTGRDMAAGEFTFDVIDVNGAVVTGGSVSAAPSGQPGAISFGTLTFNEAGDYEYTVREVGGTAGGVTYDTALFRVRIHVSDDGQGTLSAAITSITRLIDGGEQDATQDGIAFANTYAITQGVEVPLEGAKTMIGRDVAAGAFGFEVIDDNGGEQAGQVVSTGRVGALADGQSGAITFVPLSFTQPGTYRYIVREVHGGETIDGVTFDGAQWPVEIVVTDNLDGTLSATVSYPSGPVAFKNSYSVTGEASVIPQATKALVGRDLKAGEFTFTLTDAASGEVVSTATNAADGTVTFPSLHFTAAGEYEYLISEAAGREEGMNYDSASFRLHVSVADDGRGGLVATASYPDGVPSFMNTYTPPEEPEEPDTPDEPDNPDTPDEPDNPDKPDNPDEPKNPDKPGKPENPDTPGKPGTPNTPEIPKTGDLSPAGLTAAAGAIAGASLVAGAAAVLVRRHKTRGQL